MNISDLERIAMHKQYMHGDNTWYGVEFIETDAR